VCARMTHSQQPDKRGNEVSNQKKELHGYEKLEKTVLCVKEGEA